MSKKYLQTNDIGIPSVKVLFGNQLLKYIKAAKLNRSLFADYINKPDTQVGKITRGEISVGIENAEEIALYFGVHYYQMGNPDYDVPTFEQMPKALRDYVAEQKQKKVQAKQAQTAKEEKLMKELLASTFLRKPKTAEEIAEKLSSKIILKPSRVKALLRQKGLKELVKVVPGGEGRYVLRGE
ncbi:Helix-turn-helix [bacterium A37T11]|nr:Helix-turn-helix [bacterium A37T11]